MGTDAALRRVQETKVEGKTALVRVDYNVPLRGREITDDTRIRASMPTLSTLIDGGAKVVLATHLGRPDGTIVGELRLDPVADRLSEVLERDVCKLDDCVGDDVADAIEAGGPGDVFLLENLRFHAGEEENDDAFAKALARPADLYVNDAFATVHRSHASTFGVTRFLPSYAGHLMQTEVDALSRLLHDPERPYIAIVGGKKAESKLGALRDLVERVDGILVGGGVAYTFLKALGASVGDSIVDSSLLDEVASVMKRAEARGIEIALPVDALIARRLERGAETMISDARAIPEGWAGFDIGPKTVELFQTKIDAARTLVWTGPMGAFEVEPFAEGTAGVAEAVAGSGAYSVIGGGETGDAVARTGFAHAVSYVSTGGGACLALLRGKSLPALDALRG